ncbi:hypothetical protein SAMN04488105_105211 [Salipiger thiooxidans]|uniref:Sulfotransferase family protein n=1 Tax=Salipiger thiooxidans TaxID=282683 RepID=A0A1G7E971_9RHOB|nr:hypothetical protein [Salipiger thiooxidans]SDE60193.1 hypothetical protein SAMN04488105_105211 [Salipiger thiooxidans]
MTLVVIHAGFHKTGTTSVQTALTENAERLAPHLRVLLKPDFKPLTDAARACSVAPGHQSVAAVGRRAARVFRRLDRDDPRPVVLCSEDLSGHLPGRHGLCRYAAAPRIMATIAETARERFGDGTDLRFYFSTRAPEPWLRSTWWQNLRSTRLTADLDRYSETLAEGADLGRVVQEVAEAVAPCPVTSVALEDSRTRTEGPLAPLLDLTGLDPEARAALVIPLAANVRPDIGLEEVFLALNRSALKDRPLSEAKKHLRRIANRQAGLH